MGTAQGSQIFATAVQEQNMAIARALLLPNLLGVSAQGDTGSYSQARKHFDVFILIVEKQQRDLAEIVMGEQVIKPLVKLNFDVQRLPVFYFLPFTETDKGQLLGMFNQAIAAGVVQARPPDEVHVRSMTEFPEIPLEDIEAEVEAAKAAEAGGGGGGPFGGGGAEELPPGEGSAEGGEMTDEELDALIEEALGGGEVAGEKEEPEATPADEELEADIREEQPEWDDEEVAAEVAKRKGGKAFAARKPPNKKHPDLSDDELDALIDEVLGEDGGEDDAMRKGEGTDAGAADDAEEEGAVADGAGKVAEAELGAGEAAGEQDGAAAGPAGDLEPTDEEVAAGIMTEHPDWDEAAVKAAADEWRAARKNPTEPEKGLANDGAGYMPKLLDLIEPKDTSEAGAVEYARPITPLKEQEVLGILPSGKRGVWRNIGGVDVPIEVEKGESIPDAVRRTQVGGRLPESGRGAPRVRVALGSTEDLSALREKVSGLDEQLRRLEAEAGPGVTLAETGAPMKPLKGRTPKGAVWGDELELELTDGARLRGFMVMPKTYPTPDESEMTLTDGTKASFRRSQIVRGRIVAKVREAPRE